MQELVIRIRTGLNTAGVTEDKNAYGAVRRTDGVCANVIGLALIGAVGIEEAIQMSTLALEEEPGHDVPTPQSDAIAELLGLTDGQPQNLCALHLHASARDITDQLEARIVTLESWPTQSKTTA